MPPWFADPQFGKFSNDASLSQSDINTLVAWVDAGAPLGDPKDMPAPRQFVEGWTIPKPDIVFQLPKPFPVPATGVMEYQYVIIPTGFTQDTWVEQVQAAPTNYSVVHHIVAYVRAPGSNYFKDMPKNEFFEAPPAKKDGAKAPKDDVPNDWLTGYAPGQPPDMFKPGQAKLIPAGSDIVLEIHYVPEGKATTDQSRLGLVLAKEPPTERAMTLSAGNSSFKIPPGDPNFRVDASYTMPEDVTLLGMHPHMHMRGKVRAVPDRLRRRKDGDPAERAALQLALAALVRPRRAAQAAQGHEARVHRALRQLEEQPGESGPHQDGDLGPAELRRDDGLHVQRDLRRQDHHQADARAGPAETGTGERSRRAEQ